MELFRFVAVERPSAASETGLRVDLEKDLSSSKLAGELRAPKTRQARLRRIGNSNFALSARIAAKADALDALVAWIRSAKKVPAVDLAARKVSDLLGAGPGALVRDVDLGRLRATLAEQHLVDRLDGSLRPRAEQARRRGRLQAIGVIEFLARGGDSARRSLTAPSAIALQIDPERLAPADAGAGGPAGKEARISVPARDATGAPATARRPNARELDAAERDLKAAFGRFVAAELERSNDDDFDSLETAPASKGHLRKSVKEPPDPVTMLLSLRASAEATAQYSKETRPGTRRTLTRLGLGRHVSLDETLEALAAARRGERNGPPPRPRYRTFSGGGTGLDSAAEGPTPPDGAPVTVGSAQILGRGRLLRVDDRVIGYATAQLSEIYNVPGGSSKERELRVTERSEETTATVTSKVTEQETSTETEERFSLASESRKLTAFDTAARAGGAFSAGYGPVSVEASAEASVGFHSEAAEELSTAYSKNVVSRATTRVTERVEEARRRTTFRERVLGEKEAFANPLPAHITGIYQWVNEVHEGKLLQYDERLMLEVVLPRPGANLLWAAGAGPADPTAPQPPPEFDVLLDDPDDVAGDSERQERTIEPSTYLRLAARFGATDVPAPPDPVKVLTKAIIAGDQSVKGTFMTIAKTDETLRVPDGYEATQGWVRLVASRATASGATWYRVVVGTEQYKFKESGSARTFGRSLEISEARGNFRGSIPISITGREDRAAVVHVMLSCTPTDETMAAWRAEVFAALQQAHHRALAEYQDAGGSAFRAPGGRSPDQWRRIEREEIKRGSLTVITGQHFETFNALPAGQPEGAPPSLRFDELRQEQPWIRFFETAIEWENTDFVLYPYFWSDQRDWLRSLTLQVDDAKHEEFLRAGAARVLVPVRRGFEAAVIRYLESAPGSPVLWDGQDPDLIDLASSLYLPVWQELKERQGQLDDQPEVLGTWRFEVPTSHRLLRADGVLPAPPARELTVADQDQSGFLERIAASLLEDVSRGEIPGPVRTALAHEASDALAPVIAALGVDDPAGEVRDAFGVDAAASATVQASQIARSIRASLDVDWPGFDDESTAPSEPGSARREPPPDPDPEATEKEVDAFFESDADVFAELEAFEEEVGAQATEPIVSRWQLEPVKARLMTMLRASRRVAEGVPDRETLCPHRVRFEEALSLEAELGGLDRRHAYASRLSEQARQNPDLRSPGRSVGNDVHSVMQDRYLIAHGHHHVIIQEWWVYTPGRRRRETITDRRKRELTQPDPAKADYTFLVIEKARRRGRGTPTLESRWDNLDLLASELWEIKPLARLEEGVLQESYYRAKYRFSALDLLDNKLRVLVPWLEPGTRYPLRDPFTGEVLIRTRFGAVAIPVPIHSDVPGVVPYVVLRRTKDTDMVELIRRVVASLRETYAKLRRIARMVRALIAIAIIVAFVIALIIVWLLSRTDPGGGEPGKDPVPVLVPKRKKEGVIVRGWMAVAPDQRSLLARLPGGEEGAESVAMGIGGLLVVGLPIERFGDVLSKVTDAIDRAMHEWARKKPEAEPVG